MTRQITFYAVLILVCSVISPSAEETNSVTRRAALDQILHKLNHPPTDAERWMGNLPGWYDTNMHKALADFIVQK